MNVRNFRSSLKLGDKRQLHRPRYTHTCLHINSEVDLFKNHEYVNESRKVVAAGELISEKVTKCNLNYPEV